MQARLRSTSALILAGWAIVGCANGTSNDGAGETDSDSETDSDDETVGDGDGDTPDIPPECGDGVHVPGERCWHEVMTYPVSGAPRFRGAFDIDDDGQSEVLFGRDDGVNHVIWPSGPEGPVLQSNLDRKIWTVCVDRSGLTPGSVFAVEQTGPNTNQADLIRLHLDPNSPNQLAVHSRVELPHRSLGCAVGDLDDDGSPEVAISLLSVDSLTTVRVEADSMIVMQTVHAGRNPRDVQVYDLDGDGLDDVVVALDNLFGSFGAPDSYTDPGQVAVLRSSGGGELADPVTYEVADMTHGVDVGDLDGDGAPDIVAVGLNVRWENGEGTLPEPGEEVVTILWGDGAGNFDDRLDLTGGNSARNARIADFDGDGRLDFMTVAHDFSFEFGTAQLWFAGPNPRQFERMDIPLDQGLYFDIGDFNGDGVPDIVASFVTSPGLDFVLSNP
jgi:hypothetical protein